MSACRHSSFPDYPANYREFAYIANAAAPTLTILDLVNLREDRTLTLPAPPIALAASPTQPEIYALTQSSLDVIAFPANTLTAAIPLRRDPTAFSIDTLGQRAYIANATTNLITVIDLHTRRPIFSIPTPDRPTSALIAPDGRTLVVTLQTAGAVALYSVSPLGPPAPVLVLRNTFAGCPGPTSPAILANSSRLFVACSAGHTVMAIGLALDLNLPSETWDAHQDSTLLTDHLLAILKVGENPKSLTLKPDGGEVFVSNSTSNTISEIATQTNEVGSTYAIGNHPTRGIVSADGSALWIANTGADSLSLYSIADGKFLSSIRTGQSPTALAFSADEHLLLATDRTSGDIALIRTQSRLGPSLFTLLPAGPNPTAIVIKATPQKPI